MKGEGGGGVFAGHYGTVDFYSVRTHHAYFVMRFIAAARVGLLGH